MSEYSVVDRKLLPEHLIAVAKAVSAGSATGASPAQRSAAWNAARDAAPPLAIVTMAMLKVIPKMEDVLLRQVRRCRSRANPRMHLRMLPMPPMRLHPSGSRDITRNVDE